ncbi:MAG TPA: serine hydrolase domain-containing protein [Thermoanaerobaculia bacterium]|nr:serine hydrolase domain-containing protein [Thermoanaerobaculia bacterium]
MKALRLLALFVCLLVPAVAHAQRYDEQLRAFEAFAEQQLAAAPMAGLSIAVMKGDFVWSRAFGLADVENRVPAKPESSYRLASVTKAMTAVAVLKLVEEGRIELDAEVQKYVPAFPKKQWPVTVRQLLAHLGGISHYRDLAAELHFREPKNTAEALNVFRDFDLVAEPGTRFSYSSYGYVLLGAVIEAAAGKPYAEVMREKVWGPLGMQATVMDDMRAIIPNRVRGYEVANGKLRNAEYVDVSSRFAAGGTRSTVLDMIAFARGVADGKVLAPATVEQMWTPQTTKDGRFSSWGLGWDVSPAAGRFRVYHDGSQPETETYLAYFPKERFAIALAANVQNANLHPLANRLTSIFLGDQWSQRLWFRGSANDRAAGSAVITAFNHGLAYYERYGKASTTDRKKLAAAFAALNGAAEGKPVMREELIAAGSHVAQTLASRGDLAKYHGEGPFAFFDAYRGTPKLSTNLTNLVAQWSTDAKQAAAIADAATLAREASSLATATVVPDFIGELVATGQQNAMRGNIPESLRIARLAASLYPDADGPAGLLGMLLILTGDVSGGEALVRKSAALNPNGYAGPANVLRVAGFLASGPGKPAALKILSIAAELHPQDAAIAKALADLSKR